MMMQLELRSLAKKLGVTAGLIVFGASYLILSGRQFLAAHYSESQDPVRLQRAVSLDPGDAEYRDNLGRYFLALNQSPAAALPMLHEATRLNPHSAKYWFDLAAAEQSLGDIDGEKDSLGHALFADPHTPKIAWDAANLYLSQGSLEDALKLFHSVLENDPIYVGAALNTCWRIRPQIDFLLSNVVPPQADSAFLEFLVANKATEAANKVWERMFSLQQPVDRSHLFEYLRYLITNHEVSQAAMVWQQAANLSDLGAYQPSSQNLLINGDFSLEILDGGFDWVHRAVRGVSLALDPTELRSSSRTLRITLDGPGITDVGIVQLVPVEPDTRYEFSGFYKAQEMDGAGAMQFAINDAFKDTPLFMSEDLRDADFWKQVGGDFTTGPDCHLLILRVARVPAGSPIRGKLWIDSLKLVRSNSKVAELAPKETK
jgi:tetratricopeptide (TPR) repeat protein